MEQTQYIIPQFLDVEPRILGPVTVRQFVISIGGLVLIVINYKIFDFALFLLLSVFDAGLVILFGFVKIYGVHFHLFLLNYFATMKRARIRIWRKEVRDFVIRGEIGKREVIIPIPHKSVSRSRLAELSLVVNTGGRYEQELKEYRNP